MTSFSFQNTLAQIDKDGKYTSNKNLKDKYISSNRKPPMSASLRASTVPSPPPVPVFTPGITAESNFYLMTHNPEKVAPQNRVSRYDYVHHEAATNPNEYS